MLKLKDMLNWFLRRVTYEDVTDQFVFVNNWRNYGSFRAIRYPGFVLVSGLIIIGVVTANTKIIKLPSELPIDTNQAYTTYLFAHGIGSNYINSMPIRNGYICVDINMNMQPPTPSSYASIFGIIPLTDFSYGGGGVLNLLVSLFLGGGQYVKTHLNIKGSGAVVQSAHRQINIDISIHNIAKWTKVLLGWIQFCKIRRFHSIANYIQRWYRNSYSKLQYWYNDELQFFNGFYKEQKPYIGSSLRCDETGSFNINDTIRGILCHRELTGRRCSSC